MSDQYEDRVQELYEIADGAYGDSAWFRGLAKEQLRKMGHPYPVEASAHTSTSREALPCGRRGGNCQCQQEAECIHS